LFRETPRTGHEQAFGPSNERSNMTVTADRRCSAAEGPRAPGERPRTGVGRREATSAPEAPPGPLSFDRVYEEHFEFVWRSLRLLGIPAEALEDAVQDTFSVVSRQLATFEGRSQLSTWLFQILRRVAANSRRSYRRKQSPLTALEEAPSYAPTPHAHVEAVEVARVVERFCARLSPEQRELFVLAVLEDAPAREVSAALGMPVALVYSRVHALRDGLRRALALREEEHG
jgi:RNA polymerase sigma-70 factor, ECF subfamily